MPHAKVPTAYSSLRILIEITTFLALAGAAIFLVLSLRFGEFAMLHVLAVWQIVLGILVTLVLRGLANALLDIADAQRHRQ